MAAPEDISGSLLKPLLGASVAVFRADGHVLLMRRDRAPFIGAWSVPGGTVEAGETVRHAALRELEEETGARADIIGVAEVLDVIGRDANEALIHHFVVILHAARFTGGDVHAGDGASAVDWVPVSAVPGLKTTPDLYPALRKAEAVFAAQR